MRAVITMGLFLFSLAAAGQGIYKWVDENGEVHYGERPPGDAQANEMTVRQAPAPSPTVEQDRTEQQRRLLDSFQEKRAKEEEQASKAAKEAEQRQRNCAVARDRMRSVQEAGYLYNVGKDGERQVLSDDARAAAEKRAEADVKKWCK